MAERQRFATRMIQPGNPMQFSPSVPQQQGDSARLNQMQSMANQLLQFSDSFAGAFKAKFKADEAELINQQKIEKQIKKEQATEQDIIGRMFRKRYGSGVRQEQLDAMLTPQGQEGFWREHFEIELKHRNLGHKAKAKRIASRIFNAYSEEVRTGTIKNVPLEKYASIHLEHLRSQNIDEFFSVDKTGKDGTVYKDLHPIAAQVLKEKGGLNLTPYYEAIADLDAQQQKESYNSTKRRRTQSITRGTSPPIDHSDFMGRIANAQRAFGEGQFFPSSEMINDYVRDVEEDLISAESSTDPVFKELDWIDTTEDGVGVLNSGFLSEKPNVKYLSTDFLNLKKKMRDKKIQLEGQELERAERVDKKNEEDGIRKANKKSRKYIGQLTLAVTPDEVDAIISQVNREAEETETYKYGASTGYGVDKILELARERRKELVNAPSLTLKEAGEDVVKNYSDLNQKLQNLEGNEESLIQLTDEDIEKLNDEVSKFNKYTETKNELHPLINKIQKEHTRVTKEQQAEQDTLFESFIKEENDALLSDVENLLNKAEQNPDTTKDSLDTLGRKLDELTSELPDSERRQNLQTRFNTLYRLRNEKDAVAKYEENGSDARLASDLALFAVKQKDPRFTQEAILKAINKLRSNNHLLVKDKDAALKNYFDALELISGNAENEDFVKLRKEIYKNSTNRTKLNEIIQSGRLDPFRDLQEEAQSYVNNLNNEEANRKFYWEKFEANKGLFDKRLKERLAREKKLREKVRQFKLQDQQEQREYDLKLEFFRRQQEIADKIDDENRREARRKEIEKERRAYEKQWWNEKRDRLEEFQTDMYEQRKIDNEELRGIIKTEAETKAEKKLEAEQKAIDKSQELMQKYVAAKTEPERIAVISEFKSDSVQSIYTKAGNLTIYSNIQEFFTNSKTERTENDRSQTNLEIANQSQADRAKEGANLVGRAEQLLALENPDFNEIRSILGSMSVVQTWNSNSGELMSSTETTVSNGKRMEMFGKMRARQIELRNKNEDTTHSSAQAKIHLDFENRIRFFPFTKLDNESEAEFRERQQLHIGLFYSDLAGHYEKGEISKPLFNQLTTDIEEAQTDITKRKFLMAKSSPYSPIKTYENKIRDVIAKNPGGFFLDIGGASLLGMEQNRSQLYSEMITYYKNMVNEEYKNNEEFRSNVTTQFEYVSSLYDTMVEKTFKEKIDKVNNILKYLSGDISDEAVEAGTEASSPTIDAAQSATEKFIYGTN